MLIPTKQNIKTITDMREDALKLLDAVKTQGLVYLFHHSDPQAVMLSLDEFQRMQELVEDHLDEIEAKVKEKILSGAAAEHQPNNEAAVSSESET